MAIGKNEAFFGIYNKTSRLRRDISLSVEGARQINSYGDDAGGNSVEHRAPTGRLLGSRHLRTGLPKCKNTRADTPPKHTNWSGTQLTNPAGNRNYVQTDRQQMPS